jgi:hypothetical protein
LKASSADLNSQLSPDVVGDQADACYDPPRSGRPLSAVIAHLEAQADPARLSHVGGRRFTRPRDRHAAGHRFPRPVVVAVMLETMLLALIGGTIGGLVAWLLFNGFATGGLTEAARPAPRPCSAPSTSSGPVLRQAPHERSGRDRLAR